MTTRHYIDNAPTTTVPGAINASVTSFAVASLAGFPATFPYSATLGLGTASAEQVLVTAAVGTTVTVTRNSNGQGAFSHPAGETFDHTAVAQDYSEANAHVNAASGVHGVTGAGVGTSDTQTLSNKTLTSPTIATIVNGGSVTVPTGPDTLVGRATTDTLTNKTLTSPVINGGSVSATTTVAGVASDALPRGYVGESTGSGTFTAFALTGAAVAADVSVTFTLAEQRRVRIEGRALTQATGSGHAGRMSAQTAYKSGASFSAAGATNVGPIVQASVANDSGVSINPATAGGTVLLAAGTYTAGLVVEEQFTATGHLNWGCAYLAVYDVGNA